MRNWWQNAVCWKYAGCCALVRCEFMMPQPEDQAQAVERTMYNMSHRCQRKMQLTKKKSWVGCRSKTWIMHTWNTQYICLYIHICLFICIYFYICICMHIFLHLHIHMHLHLHMWTAPQCCHSLGVKVGRTPKHRKVEGNANQYVGGLCIELHCLLFLIKFYIPQEFSAMMFGHVLIYWLFSCAQWFSG